MTDGKHRLTRRRFLGDASTAVVGASAAAMLPGGLMAIDLRHHLTEDTSMPRQEAAPEPQPLAAAAGTEIPTGITIIGMVSLDDYRDCVRFCTSQLTDKDERVACIEGCRSINSSIS
jgi:hypothetical protein